MRARCSSSGMGMRWRCLCQELTGRGGEGRQRRRGIVSGFPAAGGAAEGGGCCSAVQTQGGEGIGGNRQAMVRHTSPEWLLRKRGVVSPPCSQSSDRGRVGESQCEREACWSSPAACCAQSGGVWGWRRGAGKMSGPVERDRPLHRAQAPPPLDRGCGTRAERRALRRVQHVVTPPAGRETLAQCPKSNACMSSSAAGP